MKAFHLKNSKNILGDYYEGSTQKWLPIERFCNGIVALKDGRYIKVVEVLPVNFYLKSETEQENIIFYFASYLKIAPDNLQIRVVTQKADIEEYLQKLETLAEHEENQNCRDVMESESTFVKSLSNNTAIKKRFLSSLSIRDGTMGTVADLRTYSGILQTRPTRPSGICPNAGWRC